ncbi:MAG: citramalate synthase, partial [Ferrovibrionaceae bacterium]
MTRERVYLFDTTLRDGAQTQGVDFSVEDKNRVAQALDRLGLDYVECGWPGANPTDTAFFANPPKLAKARVVAFGMTKRAGRSASNDPGLAAVLDGQASVACLVGKTWDFHVEVALGTTLEENLASIRESVAHAIERGREAIFDAEHFFDGYRANPDYALACLAAALEGGARWVTLCDTNGGMLPGWVSDVVHDVIEAAQVRVGIHCHNDTGCAVANTLAAV